MIGKIFSIIWIHVLSHQLNGSKILDGKNIVNVVSKNEISEKYFWHLSVTFDFSTTPKFISYPA